MKNKYIDLISQTHTFPQKEFNLVNNNLFFHGINIMKLIEKYGTPLKFTHLPLISKNIQKTKKWFESAIEKNKYDGNYQYCYCTKSSYYKPILNEALKNNAHIETSSAFDIDIVNNLKREGKITNNTYIICNGFKRGKYIDNIANLVNSGHKKCIPIIDDYQEVDLLSQKIEKPFFAGIRIASEESPKFEFYTSRLGIGYKDIVPFYNDSIKSNKKVKIKMLHFFINTGISDTAYYWNELLKCLNVYIELKKICLDLDSLNIGGGLPIKNSLSFDYDYKNMVNEIFYQIKYTCTKAKIEVPNIFTEFGSFTIGESSGIIYEIVSQKKQNDKEKWNIINSSFMTTLPDTWAISKRFIMLAINRWNEEYERVLLGGLTCDSDDYYNSEQHLNSIYLPKRKTNKPLYIGFFNTGAYQDTIGGVGGLQHCLIPTPKHILITENENHEIETHLFREEQKAADFLKILGYEK